jgi:hypothetical protein
MPDFKTHKRNRSPCERYIAYGLRRPRLVIARQRLQLPGLCRAAPRVQRRGRRFIDEQLRCAL